jgi:alpha-mannosidase
MPVFEKEREIIFRQLLNRLEEIRGRVFLQCQPLSDLEYCITGPGKGPENIPESGWKSFAVMDRWGHIDQTHWFRMKAKLPAGFKGCRAVAIIQPCAYTDIPGRERHNESGEALAWVNGKPCCGIDRNHSLILLKEKARGGENFEIALEANPHARFDATHVFLRADMAVMDTLAWEFYWDARVALEVLETLSGQGAEQRRLLNLIQEAVFLADLQHQAEPAAFHGSLKKAQRHLRDGLKDFERPNTMDKLTLVGQSHIDTAWLWPLRETRRKVGRTWSTVLRLMEQYPEFIFQASQPALYQFAKENHPDIWRQIKNRVKEGRWEVCGACWVEQDNNVPSGEALVRQFLYGNRFIEKEFGFRSKTAWLPDAFGFPWTLPQIMKKAGIEYFYTIKISWSEFTQFPYGFFQWQGIDGSRINAIMPPENYNGNPIPRDCINQRASFQEKERVDETIFPIGYGDGGGGPTMEMLEYARRLENINGVPACRFGRTEDCFARMTDQVEGGEKLPVWNDELYLELHRGCQTTQARTKRNNRKGEYLLQNAELLSCMAMLHGGDYDTQRLLQAWRVLLTNQFHDILPGSSITEVYEVADRDYESVFETGGALIQDAVRVLGKTIATSSPGTPVIVFNPLSRTRSDIVKVNMKTPRGSFHVIGPHYRVVPSQKTGRNEIMFEAHDVPSLGYAVYHVVSGKGEAPEMRTGPVTATTRRLENAFLKVRLDSRGCFSSVYDKRAAREVLAPGETGNMLQLFDDRPARNDAWDIDFNFDAIARDIGKPESMEVIEEGPVRGLVRAVYRTEKSVITLDLTIYAAHPRVDVAAHIDWHEKHTLLKVAFPVDIVASRAAYHIQYGVIERPNHANTDRDFARFEVPAHHWADLSEGNYGVSLINDSKYGCDVRGNVLRLSLLRSPADPDPRADEGEHRCLWSLYPHAGDWRNGTIEQGFEVNRPLIAAAVKPGRGKLDPVYSFVSVDAPNVIVDTVKKAEDSDAVILRLYESAGQRNPFMLTFGQTPEAVAECDLMEENDTPVELEDNAASLFIRPWEIRTFKVRF